MQYKYTHTVTEATTGYFSCEPHPPLSLSEALEFLAAHPLDNFMRRHILKRMAEMESADAARALFRVFPDQPLPETIKTLAEELAVINPHLKGTHPLFALPGEGAAAPDEKNGENDTSLIILRWRRLPDRHLHREWGRLFAANIQQHRSLPEPERAGLPPLYPDLPRPLPGAPDATVVHCSPTSCLPGGDTNPGLSAVFLTPFPAHIKNVHARHLAAHLQSPPGTRPPSKETAALAEERLSALGIIAGREMRHTASLSPIALLRPWNMRLAVRQGRHNFTLEGQATTYGRGLSLDDARASCLMEMVERASAYLSVTNDEVQGLAVPAPIFVGPRSALLEEGHAVLDPNNFPVETPYRDAPLVWMRGRRGHAGSQSLSGHSVAQDGSPKERDDADTVFVPVQMAGLFCNLDEIELFDSPGSTGIATGRSMEEAKLAALLEILERDAEATTPYHKGGCFTLRADEREEPFLAALLADYAERGIHVHFQDITGPMGVPVYKCFVMSPKGVIARGYGAGLKARRAIVSALTETPFPYPDGGPSGPLLRKLPVRNLSDLPDYSLGSPTAELAMLEDLLMRNARQPIYVDLTRTDLGFPVVRAFIPGMELTADHGDFGRVPVRLYANYLRLFGRS